MRESIASDTCCGAVRLNGSDAALYVLVRRTRVQAVRSVERCSLRSCLVLAGFLIKQVFRCRTDRAIDVPRERLRRGAVTSKLASLSSLLVIDRRSAVTYCGTTKPAQQIGKELAVRYLLEGVVRWAKDGAGT